ncbi:DUF6580 family putative transport protein [Runella salmonicolor]|uniref:Rod shape-determining protein MreD n=1 Tax=Runella salmonicolor TaxID=2950278 RepID=A0ABT1FN06_9BACT|nr:DUF6580 family putative transport protein [Runella salmonicolor]MCP1383145.1 hypothetical protein [Runella salmonicolor]
MKNTLNPRLLTLLCFMLAAALIRILNVAQLSPISNFTPLGAMALFSGAYFSTRWKAFAFPLITLFISDLLINAVIYQGRYGIIYEGWYWVYGIFALIVFYGKVLLQKINVKNVVLVAVIATLSHWVLSDGSVWLSGGIDLRTGLPLTRDWTGFVQCLTQGAPFMRNFLAGTLAYSALLFGGFEVLKMRFPKLAVAE